MSLEFQFIILMAAEAGLFVVASLLVAAAMARLAKWKARK